MDTNHPLLYASHPLFDVVKIIGDRVDPLTNVSQMFKHKIVGFASHGVVFLLCFPPGSSFITVSIQPADEASSLK